MSKKTPGGDPLGDLREREEHFRRLIEHSIDLIYSADRNGTFTYVSPAIKRYGLQPEEVIGSSFLSFVHPDDRSRVIENFTKSVSEGIEEPITFRALGKDGVTGVLEVSSRTVRNASGEIHQVIGFAHDITQQIEARDEAEGVRRDLETALERARNLAREAARADEAKTQFLANMSHELRTPMNAIMGLTELLLNSPLSNTQKEELSMVSEAAERLLLLLDDLLNFSKIEAGKVELEAVRFNLLECLEQPVRLLTAKAQKKGLTIALETENNLPTAITGDPARLQQVLFNLIGNAVKFTEKGEVLIKVGIVKQSRKKIWLYFSIRDTGIGIPLDFQDLIFDTFRQADGSMTRKYGGTGLGLAITRKLVKLMGGTISLESEPGRGSHFKVTLPFLPGQTDERSESRPESSTRGIEKTEKSSTILLAEDEMLNQEYATRLLEARGHQVVKVQSGLEVLKTLRQASFDLILMDIQMPEMDGIEAASAIREKERRTGRHIPIVALTAYASRNDRLKCMKAGMDGYLSKPFKSSELFPLVERLIRKSQESREKKPAPGRKKRGPVTFIQSLEERLGSNNTMIMDLLVTFRTVLPIYVDNIEKAFEQRDSDALRKSAHKLHGACAPCGVKGIAKKALALEQGGEDWQAAEKMLKKLRLEYHQVMQELSELKE